MCVLALYCVLYSYLCIKYRDFWWVFLCVCVCACMFFQALLWVLSWHWSMLRWLTASFSLGPTCSFHCPRPNLLIPWPTSCNIFPPAPFLLYNGCVRRVLSHLFSPTRLYWPTVYTGPHVYNINVHVSALYTVCVSVCLLVLCVHSYVRVWECVCACGQLA